MHRSLLSGLVLSVVLLLPPRLGLATPSPVEILEVPPLEIARRLQKTYNMAQIMKADFRQETSIPLSNRQKQGNGTVIFEKPGKMRWDYLSPDRQVLISDGNSITIYLENSNQVIISPARQYLQSDVTYSFFSGSGDILRDFEVLASDLNSGNTIDGTLPPIKLVPKIPHPQVDHLYIWATPVTFLIRQMQIVDHFDTITNLYFESITLDDATGGSNDSLFFFTPPEGAEIIEQ